MKSTLKALSVAGMLFGVSLVVPGAAIAQGNSQKAIEQQHKANEEIKKENKEATEQTKKQNEIYNEQAKKDAEFSKKEQHLDTEVAKKRAELARERDHQSYELAKKRAELARNAGYSRTYSKRYHVLCEDGLWTSHSKGCANHGGVAARQYTPRASEEAILHANEHSAVARAYANGISRRAIARCVDGTYWHATTRVDACSNHGGVARWL